MEKTHCYIGWELNPQEREQLLKIIPPQFANVVAHHVTLEYRVRTRVPVPEPKVGFIVGEIMDNGVQALVVEIDGDTIRPDGERFHITWSLDEGRYPQNARELVRRGWYPHGERIPVTLTPMRVFL